MWLKQLEADRLRNLSSISLALEPGLTLIVGRNGQGKTSLLESAYLLGTAQSFRTRRLEEAVSWNGGPLRVSGTVESENRSSVLTVLVDEGRRSILADGSERSLEEFIGRLDVVDLNGERMKVLRGGPEERRRFIDRGIVGLTPSYLRAIGEYRRVVHQRNALLRSSSAQRAGGVSTQLDAWDERLVVASQEVHLRRRVYVERLAAQMSEVSRILFPASEKLHLVYRPSPSAAGEAAPAELLESLWNQLGKGRERDLMVGHTCRGPHRDDLLIELDGVDLRKYGSAGQVRATMVALKLGKLSMLREIRGDAPLFLMDDFDTDLDEIRASALAGFLQSGGFQALVATSKEGLAGRLAVSLSKIRMENGTARAA